MFYIFSIILKDEYAYEEAVKLTVDIKNSKSLILQIRSFISIHRKTSSMIYDLKVKYYLTELNMD